MGLEGVWRVSDFVRCKNSLSRANQGKSGHLNWSGQTGHPGGIRQGRFEYITDLRGLVRGGPRESSVGLTLLLGNLLLILLIL